MRVVFKPEYVARVGISVVTADCARLVERHGCIFVVLPTINGGFVAFSEGRWRREQELELYAYQWAPRETHAGGRA
jgi:hypothetical protein